MDRITCIQTTRKSNEIIFNKFCRSLLSNINRNGCPSIKNLNKALGKDLRTCLIMPDYTELCTVRAWDARFWGREKNRAAQISCNFCRGKMIRKPCCSRFSLHKFVHLKIFLNQFKNVHLRGPCSLRPCISRPYWIVMERNFSSTRGL